jgi:hypothetical protein
MRYPAPKDSIVRPSVNPEASFRSIMQGRVIARVRGAGGEILQKLQAAGCVITHGESSMLVALPNGDFEPGKSPIPKDDTAKIISELLQQGIAEIVEGKLPEAAVV